MANNSRVNLRRKITDGIASMLCVAAVIIVVAPLCAIFFYLIVKGAGSLNLAFLTHTPKPVGESGGGFGNAIAGSAYIRSIRPSSWLSPYRWLRFMPFRGRILSSASRPPRLPVRASITRLSTWPHCAAT